MGNRCRLEVELLEARCTPAGNVVAFASGGDLVVIGGAARNHIDINPGPRAGQFTIFGLGGTTVNGKASDTIRGINDDFRISLGDGGDSLCLTNVRVPDSLFIDTGRGNDLLTLGNVRVGGNLSAFTGGGRDDASLEAVRVAGLTSIATGGDNDQLAIVNSAFSAFFLSLGSGADEVGIAGSQWSGFALFNGDSGFNVLVDGGGNSFDAGLATFNLVRTSGDVSVRICPLPA